LPKWRGKIESLADDLSELRRQRITLYERREKSLGHLRQRFCTIKIANGKSGPGFWYVQPAVCSEPAPQRLRKSEMLATTAGAAKPHRLTTLSSTH
jgi:hypothetical protein